MNKTTLHKKKIGASTLYEVIIAITIIAICTGIALEVLGNVLLYQNTSMKSKAFYSINNMVQLTEKNRTCSDTIFTVNNIIFEQNVLPYDTLPGLLLIEWTARRQDLHLLAQRKRIIKTKKYKIP